MEPVASKTEYPCKKPLDRLNVTGLTSKRSFDQYQRALISTLAMVLLLILVLICLVSILPEFGTFLSSAWVASERHNEVLLAPESRVAASLSRDDVADIPLDLRRELMGPSPLAHVEFSRRFMQSIDKICESLGGLGLGRFTTMHNPVAEEQWICSSDVLPAGGNGASSTTSSVFVWMRGTERREIDLVRLKINLTDPATSEAAKTLALKLFERLYALLGWDMPTALGNAIHEAKDASFDRYGLTYQIKREWSSVPRLNVVLYPRDRSGIIPVDSFKVDSLGLNSP